MVRSNEYIYLEIEPFEEHPALLCGIIFQIQNELGKRIEMNESVSRKSGRDMQMHPHSHIAPTRKEEKKNLNLFGMTFSFVRSAAPVSVCVLAFLQLNLHSIRISSFLFCSSRLLRTD